MSSLNDTSSSVPVSPVVKVLLALNIAIFLVELSRPEELIGRYALWPLASGMDLDYPGEVPHFQPLQLITYAFLHGSPMHLFFNMYALWMFGVPLERRWGSVRFLVFYFVCVAGAGLTQLLVAWHSGNAYPTIGASGGVFGILLAFGMTYPNVRLALLFPPMILRAKTFVMLYGTVELLFGISGADSQVAHFAHLGGMLFGYLLIRYWGSRFRF